MLGKKIRNVIVPGQHHGAPLNSDNRDGPISGNGVLQSACTRDFSDSSRRTRASTPQHCSTRSCAGVTMPSAQRDGPGPYVQLSDPSLPRHATATSVEKSQHNRSREVPCRDEVTEADSAAASAGVANAALVARGALKSGYLWKMGANVPRWKRRYFVLKPITMLFYYLTEHDTEPRGCIDLDLFDAVRRVGPEQQNHGGEGGEGAEGGVVSRRTAFELYRSGCPEGSGFMLEARGHEDWEHWVETIANGRHGKMQAEADVLKGTNKLLLEEIQGLERQVETFRGYADQRHVTVLALRDERQRNRDMLANIRSLGDTAVALSQHIEDSNRSTRKDEALRSQESSRPDGQPAAQESNREDRRLGTVRGGEAEEVGDGSPFSMPHLEDSARSSILNSGCGYANAGYDCDDSATVSTASISEAGGSRHGPSADSTLHQNQDGETKTPNARETGSSDHQEEDENASFKAVQVALEQARTELDHRGAAFRREEKARRAVEARVKAAEDAARAAEARARAAEAVASKARGRVSVLERNVDYLQAQQQSLRAEISQSKQRCQRERAKTSVLKRELREMWAGSGGATQRRASAPFSGSSSNPQHRQNRQHPRRRFATTSIIPESSSLPRSRTMSDLMEYDDDASANEVRRGGNFTEAGAATGGGLRYPVSKVGLASASDGGETDMAEQSISEASDDDYKTTDISSGGTQPQQEPSPFGASIRRSIRQQVGNVDVPALPPPRQQRILEAAKRMAAAPAAAAPTAAPTAAPAASADSRTTVSQREAATSSTPGSGTSNGGDSLTPLVQMPSPIRDVSGGAGLAVAGSLLSELKKGMVEKATQGIGSKLWAAAQNAQGSPWQPHQQQPNDGPSLAPSVSQRMTASRSATSLPDFAARWGLASGGGGPASSGLEPRSTESVPARTGSAMSDLRSISPSLSSSFAPAVDAVTAALSTNSADSTAPLVDGGYGRTGDSLPSAVSRTALIQLSDLEPEAGVPPESHGEQQSPDGPVTDSGADTDQKNNVQPVVLPGQDNAKDEDHTRRRRGAPVTGSTTRSGGVRRRRPSAAVTGTKLPQRPDDTYELVFENRVLGLQIQKGPDDLNVTVSGREGYTGPATRSGFLFGPVLNTVQTRTPEIGDILEYYNGRSTTGMSPDAVARELATCERPLTLVFRSAPRPGSEVFPASEPDESSEESEEEWSFDAGDEADSTGGGVAEGNGIFQGSAGASGGGGTTCAAEQGVVIRGGGPWRETVTNTPQWGLS